MYYPTCDITTIFDARLLDGARSRNVDVHRGNLGKRSVLQMKEVFLLCTCQSVSEGLREHSVLPLCVCVWGGLGVLGFGRDSRGAL